MELSDASAEAVVVESAEIKTEITGRIAVTTYDLVFRNPNSRVLEGSFVLPLLDGQTVVRFALDINGTLREAVPVDKTRGRVVFEEIERRRVDPGLLEQTAGNNYRARVFPLPARGTRRIVIAFQEDLVRSERQPVYRLNLDFPTPLQRFRLALSAHSVATAPGVRSTLGIELPSWRPGYVMEIVREAFAPRGVLEVELPSLAQPTVLTGHWKGEEYFYAETPIVPASRPRPVPRVVGLLWDSSGSGRERDHEREFAVLDAWFRTVRNVSVRLVRLRDEAAAPIDFAIEDGDWTALKAELQRTEYDGATSLDGLTHDPSVDEWLLFSDGLVNYGLTSATKPLPLLGAVHTVLASPGADSAWLRGVAVRHDGEFVNLLEMPPSAAAARLRARSARVLSVDYLRDEAAEIYPEPGTPLDDGPLVITGVLRGLHATVRMRLGTSESDAQTIEVTADSRENPSPLAPRGWASAKINRLALNFAANRADIRQTSREFGIVTADTSLIVLETVADYVHYEIEPPAELLSAWKSQRRTFARAREKERDAHLAKVVAAFEARVAWWEKSFPKDAPPVHARTAPPAETAPPARAPSQTPAAASQLPVRTAIDEKDAIIVLSPFEVSTDRSSGYLAANAISGTRLGTASRTASSAVSAPAATAAPSTTIRLQPWTPAASYLDRLRRADARNAYAIYLEERVRHGRMPGFFLDVANFFFERKDAVLARRVLSNLAELELEDVALLRVLAHRLAQAERPDLALPLFERVLALRSDEPQSRRDLALVCAELKHYQRAVDLLGEIVTQSWGNRFPEIELIALAELNAIAATCGETLNLSRIDRRLLKNLPVQSRVTLTWDTNDCDIDLWVTDPNAEIARYNNPLTYQGGRMSQDLRDGYGPEEFMLHVAKPGTYQVAIDYFADSRVTALGPVTAQVRLITDFGLPTQREERITVRLDHAKHTLAIGSFDVRPRKTNARPAKLSRAR